MEHNKETASTTRGESHASLGSNGSPTHELRQKSTAGDKFKGHCRRFWWLDFLIFAAIVLVIVLPIVYVGVPNKAQSEVNKSTLVVNSQNVSDPTSSSIDLTMDTTLTSHSSYHPEMDAFNVSLFLESSEPDIKPFGYIEIPKTHINSNTTIDISQTMQIADQEQFIAYNQIVVNSTEFRVAMRGKPKMKLSGLPSFTVDYNKVVTMKGLDKLSGFDITSTQLVVPAAADGTTMNGTISIPNPSVMTIAMGTVNMTLAVGTTTIGTTAIKDLVLAPGDNSADMNAIVNTTLVLGLVEEEYTDGVLPISVVGISCTNDAGEELVYYEEALGANPLAFNLNLTSALAELGL